MQMDSGCDLVELGASSKTARISRDFKSSKFNCFFFLTNKFIVTVHTLKFLLCLFLINVKTKIRPIKKLKPICKVTLR